MPTTTPPGAAAPSARWPDLPPDLLRTISGRLCALTDYVRFHAVCKPWREAIPPAHSRPAFPPWLVALRDATGHRKACCVLPSVSGPHGTAATEVRVRDRRWVISANDGTAICWLLTDSNAESRDKRVLEPLTGSAAATPLPRCPDERKRWEDHTVGVSSADGTIVLYAQGRVNTDNYTGVILDLDLVLRRPGDAEWTPLQRHDVYMYRNDMNHYRVVCHNGKILVCSKRSWFILPSQTWRYMGTVEDDPGMMFLRCHLVESQGELLYVVVRLRLQQHCKNGFSDRIGDVSDFASALSVSVYKLQELEGGFTYWAKKDGRTLADRVLFLGRPSSFAIDSARIGMRGSGCAYFVDRRMLHGMALSEPPLSRCRVFKYDFIAGTSEFVAELPEEWDDMGCMWITPQPSIASTEEIRKRLQLHKRQ